MGISREDGDVANVHLRFKVAAGYNIKKWKLDPVLSAEIFNQRGIDSGFDKFRVTLATGYKVKKVGEFGAFYRLERELNATYPMTTYILGLNYTYTLKLK